MPWRTARKPVKPPKQQRKQSRDTTHQRSRHVRLLLCPKRTVSSDAMTARHLCRANNSSATPHKAGRSKRGLVATLSTELAKMEALFYNLPIALTRPTGNKKGLHTVQSFLSAYGGDARIRTGGKGFAGLCLTTWPRRRLKKPTVKNRIGLRNQMERTTGFEPATPTLARLCSSS